MSYKWPIGLALASHLLLARPMEAQEKKPLACPPLTESLAPRAIYGRKMPMSRHSANYEWKKTIVRRSGLRQSADRSHWEHTYEGPFEKVLSASKRIKLFYRCCRCGQVLTDRLVEVLGPDLASVILPCRSAGFEQFMKRRWMN